MKPHTMQTRAFRAVKAFDRQLTIARLRGIRAAHRCPLRDAIALRLRRFLSIARLEAGGHISGGSKDEPSHRQTQD